MMDVTFLSIFKNVILHYFSKKVQQVKRYTNNFAPISIKKEKICIQFSGRNPMI